MSTSSTRQTKTDSAAHFELLDGQRHWQTGSVDTLPLWEQYNPHRNSLPEGAAPAHGMAGAAASGHPSPGLPPFYSSPHPSVGDILETPNASVGRFSEYTPLDSSRKGYFTEKSSPTDYISRLRDARESGSPLKRGGGRGSSGSLWQRRKKWIIALGLLVLLLIAGAVIGGLMASRSSKDNQRSSIPSNSSPEVDGDGETWGGNGSIITAENGEKFMYNSTFGGLWVSTPFNNSAKVRSDVPALDETWDFSKDLINGVNVGGWFVLEPFITPALFEQYADTANPVLDEWDLCIQWGSNLSAAMEDHYNTFITEKDFAQMAEAGLNWVRIPIPYWFVEVADGEPWLEGVGWKYFLKAITWARKYGIRVEMDIHALPGSQNGQNHSGKLGSTNMLNGTMGLVNVQRSLNVIRTFAEFASQPQYQPVIQSYMIANELNVYGIGVEQTKAFYFEAYKMLRSITGVGQGKGPMLVLHDGFQPPSVWEGYLQGADRVAKEIHQYLAYSPDYFTSGPYTDTMLRPCQWWSASYNTSMNNFGYTFMGEWALANNDCGQYIQGVNRGAYYDDTWTGNNTFTKFGDCAPILDYENYSDEFKNQMQQGAHAYWDATRNWIFWSWKMGANSTGKVPNPQWSYQLGYELGWMPKDPRPQAYIGQCDVLAQQYGQAGPTSVAFSTLSAWMTGGSGADTVVNTESYAQWPVTALMNIPAVTNLPTYTQTASPVTMPASSPTAGVYDVGNGWHNPSDTAAWYTTVAGCSYGNAFSGADQPIPEAPCTGAAQRMVVRHARPTAMPA